MENIDRMNDLTIGQRADGRNNNLDFIRFLAAIMVIYSHSFPLGSGDNSKEVVLVATGGKWDAGALAVAIFFIISGFLITQSFERSHSLGSYIKARILRIFPGLAASLVVSTFIIGTLFTNLSIKEYLRSYQTYDYLKSFFILIYPMRWNLPGLFESNIYKGSVNGSLWTIPFEFFCYIIVAVIGIIGLVKHRKLVLLLFLITVYYCSFNQEISFGITHFSGLEIRKLMELFSYFSAGIVFYLYRNMIPLNKHCAMICLIMLGFTFMFGGAKEFFVVFGSYLIFYLAYTPSINLTKFSKYGDFSYGLYIYAFPVQQTITHLFGGKMSSFHNFILSLFVTLLFAIISWHLLEKQALKLKKVTLLPKSFSKISTSNISKSFYRFTDKMYKMNWPVFLAFSILLFTSLILYNQKPSVLTFPYSKNNNIFQGDWLPQSSTENYRWVARDASVTLEKPSKANNLVVEGFIPESFIEVNHLKIFINGQKTTEINVSPGSPIAVNSPINVNQKLLQIRFEFNESHKPRPDDADQRQMSALINKIILR